MEKALSVKQQYCSWLLTRKNVISVGVGFGYTNGERRNEPCTVVGVTEKVPCTQLSQTQQIPHSLGGVRTDVQQVGIIRALQNRTDRWRPAPGGVSIGHANITAGTSGCLVAKEGQAFILSNNHVLANSGRAKIGDFIFQPGTYDGGKQPDDQIAVLEDFVPIQFDFEIPNCPATKLLAKILNKFLLSIDSKQRFKAVKLATCLPTRQATNLVDCAIARPLSDDLVVNQILDIGFPLGAAESELGMEVQKSGRTSELTTGKITQVNMTVRVLYGTALATFEDQLAGDLLSEGGDSGSAVLNKNNQVVGLLFAGGEGITIFNRIQNVTKALEVSL